MCDTTDVPHDEAAILHALLTSAAAEPEENVTWHVILGKRRGGGLLRRHAWRDKAHGVSDLRHCGTYPHHSPVV
jgi:hypothetical protein